MKRKGVWSSGGPVYFEGMLTPTALCHGYEMTTGPRFLDETVERSKDYNSKSFGQHEPLVWTHMGS